MTPDDAKLRATILNGVAGSEMPAFRGVLDDGEVTDVIALLREGVPAGAAPASLPASKVAGFDRVITTGAGRFHLQLVTRGLDTPWGLAFLPDGRLLVTERAGRLRIVDRSGRLDPRPVRNTPVVWTGQDAGLLDVAVHPDWRHNGWVYLAYSDHVGAVTPGTGGAQAHARSMTVIVRGRVKNGAWTDTRTIFRAPDALYTGSGAHYGCRFLFDDRGHLFFTLGDRGEMRNAQDLSSPLGKIHRVNDDGSIPPDNPFVRTPGAVPSIWSYGHRNPEGLAFAPATRLLWESEHGPDGGDEINIIDKGGNYGWGVVSMGVQPGITRQAAPGMTPPVAWYTPAIAPSGIAFSTSPRYPRWRRSLLVTGLKGRQLRRLEVDGRQVVGQEVLFEGFARARAVTTGPDGLLYILLQEPTGAGTATPLSDPSPGAIMRLVPLP